MCSSPLFFEHLHIGSLELRDILGDLLKVQNILIVEYDILTIYKSYNVIFKLFIESLLTRPMAPTTAV